MNTEKFVDLQVNGCLGVDFSAPDLSSKDCAKAIGHVLASGTGIFLPTLITSPLEIYRRNIALIREVVAGNGWHDNVPGVHLEGPFLSDRPGAVGCHDPALVRKPSASLLDELDFVCMITVAAEYPETPDFIRAAAAKGVIVSLGHHLADSAQINAAAAAGAKTLTHLGNGCPNLLDRHRNPVWAGLACDSLTAMIIADGHHLPGEVVKCMIRCKGVDRVIVTSDASPGAGLPPGHYHLLGNDAILEPDGLLHNPEKKCLVGSTAMLRDCCAFLRSLGFLSEDELDRLCRRNALALLNSAK